MIPGFKNSQIALKQTIPSASFSIRFIQARKMKSVLWMLNDFSDWIFRNENYSPSILPQGFGVFCCALKSSHDWEQFEISPGIYASSWMARATGLLCRSTVFDTAQSRLSGFSARAAPIGPRLQGGGANHDANKYITANMLLFCQFCRQLIKPIEA